MHFYRRKSLVVRIGENRSWTAAIATALNSNQKIGNVSHKSRIGGRIDASRMTYSALKTPGGVLRGESMSTSAIPPSPFPKGVSVNVI